MMSRNGGAGRKGSGKAPAAGTAATVPREPERIVEKVRDRYAGIATGALPGCCGAGAPGGGCATDEAEAARLIGYAAEDLSSLPQGANLGLGCGAPVALLDLEPGETVLDLGSGPGLDALLAARKVGPTGRVIGVDMTREMLERARANAAAAGMAQAEFREGRLEALPVADRSVDAVTSNCVINLVPDKGRVFREIARVLRPGGRLVISDILLDGVLPPPVASDLLAYVGCVAGAMERRAYFARVEEAGLRDVAILSDVDYLAAAGYEFSPEVRALLDHQGIRPADLAGIVRSVTFRAVSGAA
jgi:arsenite methyltransferase